MNLVKRNKHKIKGLRVSPWRQSTDEFIADMLPPMLVHYYLLCWPKNGMYSNKILNYYLNFLDPKVRAYHLKLSCYDGFKGIGSDTMVCFEDGRKIDTDFECIPYCEEDNNVFSCGSNSQCIRRPERSAPNTTYMSSDAAQKNYAECGRREPLRNRRRRQVTRASLLPQTNVSGGWKAYIADMPWHAAVYTKKTNPYMQICGGTLVSTRVVISAAHCFWSEEEKQLPASHYAVAVGKVYRPWNEPRDRDAQKSDVDEIKIPPYFQGHATNLQDDISILLLASPITFGKNVRPACLDFDVELDKEQLKPGTLGQVPGWGLTSEDGPASPVLKLLEIPTVDIKDCFQQSDPTFRSHITSDKFCAGYKNGSAVCKGDSGGGLFFPKRCGGFTRMIFRGIVSGAPQNEHLCNVFTWASFTHVQKHERFIRDALQGNNNTQINDRT